MENSHFSNSLQTGNKNIMSSKRKHQSEEKKSAPPGLRKKKPAVLYKMRPELKFVDSGTDFFVPKFLLANLNYNDCNDVTYRLNLVAQGTDRANRVGRKIVITRIEISGFLDNINHEVPFDAKMIVWLDKEASAPVSTQILSVYKKDSATNALNYNLIRDLNDSARYKVLAIKEFGHVGAGTGVAPNEVQPSSKQASAHLNVQIPVNYPSSGSSPVDNLMMVSFVCSRLQGSGAAFTISPEIKFQCRVMFTDQ